MSIECNSCKGVNVKVVNTYHEVDELSRSVAWDEMECSDCKAYSQTSRLDPDYDPTPE
jgi:hypothetical protein